MTRVSPDQSGMTVRELMNRYIDHMSPKWKHPQNFLSHADMMLEFFGRRTLAELCEAGKLVSLCKEYNRLRGKAAGTITKQLRTLQAALRWAWKEQWIAGLPAMWVPGPGEPRDRDLTTDEVDRLLKASGEYPTPAHLRPFLYLTVHTQQYRDVINALTWDHVDFKRRTITFPGERKVVHSMDDELFEAMTEAKAAAKPGCNFVVAHNGKQITSSYHSIQSLLDRVGLSDVTLNDLRRFRSIGASDRAAQDEGPKPMSISDLFISLAGDGKLYGDQLAKALAAFGRTCWMAHRDADHGIPYPGQITRAIKGCEALIVLVTPGANESADVVREVQKAQRLRRTIFPIIINGTEPNDELEYFLDLPHQLHWSDAESAAKAVVRTLNKIAAAR